MVTLIIGGARSGKSSFAEEYCIKKSNNLAYIATAQVYDSEMEVRVKKHRDRRTNIWTNYEEPYNVSALLKDILPKHSVILLDCLTLYITNILLQDYSDDLRDMDKFLIEKEEKMKLEIKKIISLIPKDQELVIVSNEVGLGIVPENFLARVFRDMSGRMNQYIAEECEQVIFTVAGIPIKIKPVLERI